MSRDASSRAKAASDQAVVTAKDYGGKADKLFGQLSSIYGGQYANPSGMSPTELSDARTAGEQSVGGSVAGAVGQGNLQAARTGNAGGYAAALDQAHRTGIAQNSQNALNVQNANTGIKLAQQQSGLQGMQVLQSGAEQGQLGAMGNNVGAINAETSASPGWFQNLTGLINAGANVWNATHGKGGPSMSVSGAE